MRRIDATLVAVFALGALAVRCSDTEPGAATNGSGGAAVSGGAQSHGGAPNGGSPAAAGGTISSGGASSGGSSSGGVSGVGGSPSLGGASTSGGAMSGGALTSGGTTSGGTTSGGTSSGGTSSGGAFTSGGATSGGKASTGGAAGMGGSASGGASGSSGSGGSAGAGTYRPCPTSGACKIMPFGDSITDGYGVAGGYRVELFRLAHSAGKNITFVGTQSNSPGQVDGVTFPPNHEGHSGFTIAPTPSRSGISPLVATVMPQFTPHIITLMIGTNDAIDDYQLNNAPMRLGALIDSIYAQLPNVLIVVGQPIPSQEDPLNGRIQAYNATIPAVVKTRADAGRQILLVDMYGPFVANAAYKTALLKDTWHPNEAGHRILGARWYEVLGPLL